MNHTTNAQRLSGSFEKCLTQGLFHWQTCRSASARPAVRGGRAEVVLQRAPVVAFFFFLFCSFYFLQRQIEHEARPASSIIVPSNPLTDRSRVVARRGCLPGSPLCSPRGTREKISVDRQEMRGGATECNRGWNLTRSARN